MWMRRNRVSWHLLSCWLLSSCVVPVAADAEPHMVAVEAGPSSVAAGAGVELVFVVQLAVFLRASVDDIVLY